MTVMSDLGPELSARVDDVAKRAGLSRAEIIREALEFGRSLDWQEEWFRRIQAGIDAAEKDDFASEAEMSALLEKYR